jgi:hypothetical protein
MFSKIEMQNYIKYSFGAVSLGLYLVRFLPAVHSIPDESGDAIPIRASDKF